jgi:Microfibril-associated/Pre-mRNA processing
MQKYYHKGAFGTGDEKLETALQATDGSAPTLEDHFGTLNLCRLLYTT